VLLESASFDPVNTRRTRAALRLSTEASHRFERGIRAELVPRALRRATRLVLELADGKAAQGIIDQYPGRTERPPLRISSRRAKQVLGLDLGMGKIASVLTSLGFEPADPPAGSGDGDDTQKALWVKVPYWRSDVGIEDDLVEEVARIVGYDNIPTTMPSAPIPHHEPRPQRELREHVKDILAAEGLREVISYSLTDLQTLAAVEAIDGGPEPLKVANAISSEHQILRTSLRGSLLRTLSANRRVAQDEGVRIFEVGSVYIPKEEAREGDLPDEREMLVGVLSGRRFATSWLASDADLDFFDAKGVLDALFERIGIEADFVAAEDTVMHTGKAARLACRGQDVGVVGEVHPRVLERFDLEGANVAMFEVDLEALVEAVPARPDLYREASRFPESERDLALVVDADVPSARIQAVILRQKLVRRSTPFDLYAGAGVPLGKKSVAYRVVFQSSKGTLTTEEVDKAQSDIVRRLGKELGAELRGSTG